MKSDVRKAILDQAFEQLFGKEYHNVIVPTKAKKSYNQLQIFMYAVENLSNNLDDFNNAIKRCRQIKQNILNRTEMSGISEHRGGLYGVHELENAYKQNKKQYHTTEDERKEYIAELMTAKRLLSDAVTRKRDLLDTILPDTANYIQEMKEKIRCCDMYPQLELYDIEKAMQEIFTDASC